ncbi:TIGR02281 family clan AA aspartic protease [Bartonella tamiae Th307]|uniref:TIGR02281 family clan AA aspartic protease n=2 Tax=Bartonella tamiae TaxID=373638 RepID=J0QZR1_9HYPH|nr:TIGR02281 family clan AA aspartic protease [Bartonella tamiae Th239]EJF95011.1 TIGR02281 family clan AA aspartic protease [Bartonella tamiae Th307]
MRLFWILLACVGVLTLISMGLKHFSDSNINSDQITSLSYYGIVGLIVASGLLGSGIKLSHMIRNLIIWCSIIFALMFFYNSRYEIQDIANQLTVGIIPGSPLTQYNESGIRVSLQRSLNGHFATQAILNGKNIRFTVDTGASTIVLRFEDAITAGINVKNLHFSVPIKTANGNTYAALTIIDSLNIGGIKRTNVSALISQKGRLSTNLLGMSFLNSLSGYSVRGDRLIMVD